MNAICSRKKTNDTSRFPCTDGRHHTDCLSPSAAEPLALSLRPNHPPGRPPTATRDCRSLPGSHRSCHPFGAALMYSACPLAGSSTLSARSRAPPRELFLTVSFSPVIDRSSRFNSVPLAALTVDSSRATVRYRTLWPARERHAWGGNGVGRHRRWRRQNTAPW